MLAGVFIAGGMGVLANPEPRARLAKPGGSGLMEHLGTHRGY
jgi:hypothetical protein